MLTRLQLDAMGCAHCSTHATDGHEHGPLYLHSRCHPEDPTWVIYVDGVLTIVCSVCEDVIAAVKVAAQ